MDEASVRIEEVQGPAYATFTVRARALVIDAAVLALGLIVVMLLSSFTENLPGSGGMTVIAFFALLIFYEPILVAVYGATLGHRWSNLRVIRQSTGRPPNLFVAFGRFLLKAFLGLPSFVTMAFTRRHQALHDLLTGTTVQLRDVAVAQEFEYVNERAEEANVALPAPWRRVATSVVYAIAAYILASFLSLVLISRRCLQTSSCGLVDRALATVILGAFLVGIPLIFILGWQGRLPGARRSLVTASADAA